MKRVLLLLFTLLFASSCTSYVNISITDFSFTLESTNTFSDATLNLVSDFNDVLKDEIVLEEKSFRSYDTYDIIKALSQDNENPIITISDDKKDYNININAENYQKLGNIFTLLRDENVESYGAKYNKDEDEESFFEILNYVFGKEIEIAARSSSANIVIKTPSKVKYVKGAEKISDDCISVSIPLIDFALLKKPIAISFGIE